jgi:hypothetical protein
MSLASGSFNDEDRTVCVKRRTSSPKNAKKPTEKKEKEEDARATSALQRWLFFPNDELEITFSTPLGVFLRGCCDGGEVEIIDVVVVTASRRKKVSILSCSPRKNFSLFTGRGSSPCQMIKVRTVDVDAFQSDRIQI